jgi:hypothetical protein
MTSSLRNKRRANILIETIPSLTKFLHLKAGMEMESEIPIQKGFGKTSTKMNSISKESFLGIILTTETLTTILSMSMTLYIYFPIMLGTIMTRTLSRSKPGMLQC